MLRAADELHIDSFISDATWKTLSARYDIKQMVDTIDTVGALTMHAGVMNSLGVQVEADVEGPAAAACRSAWRRSGPTSGWRARRPDPAGERHRGRTWRRCERVPHVQPQSAGGPRARRDEHAGQQPNACSRNNASCC